MKKVVLLACVIIACILTSCIDTKSDDKFTDDNIENSYWRFYAVNVNPYSFSYGALSNGTVVKFNPGNNVQVLNYTEELDDESKWVSSKDTLSTFYTDFHYTISNYRQYKTFIFKQLKKESKTRYSGYGALYNIVLSTNSQTGVTTKNRTLDSYFYVVGERLTKDEAYNFSNKSYSRPIEILSKTKWKLIITAPFDKNTTYKSGNGLKDTIVNIDFKWFHGIYLHDYFYSSAPDSTGWIQTGIVSETLNGNWWYQTSDTTVLFNIGFNDLNPYQSMKFNGTFKNGVIKGTCNSYMTSSEYKFKGTIQK
jgi:hypothetical protein